MKFFSLYKKTIYCHSNNAFVARHFAARLFLHMALDTFIALLIFAFVATATPGPNNMMLLASGVNFGYRRSLPHMIGITIGFFVMLFAVGAGLGALLTSAPQIHTALKFIGGGYLLYLAWRIANAGKIHKADKTGKPMTFMAAALFQWVNPKGWMMGVSAMAIYTDAEHPFFSVFLVAATFGIISFPIISIWTGFGTALSGFLQDPARRRAFNISMGILLALCVIPMVR